MKTVTLDEEAYAVLNGLKVDGKDSFSKVVKRHFRRSGRLRSSAGAWSDLTKAEEERLRRETVQAFEPRRRR